MSGQISENEPRISRMTRINPQVDCKCADHEPAGCDVHSIGVVRAIRGQRKRHGKLIAARRNDVAQIVNLPYRRLAIGGASANLWAGCRVKGGGLPTRDTADCQSAIRFRGMEK
jgi:hypothetical protein